MDATTDGAVREGHGHVYRIGPAELDEPRRELRVGGHPVPVEPKSFDVLLALARRPGETLTKDELFDAVWPGRVVTEGVLAKSVMKLRALLGDDEQSIIKTVHGYGYRLVAPVERLAGEAAHAWAPRAGEAVPHRPNWRLERALGAGGYALVWLARHAKTGERRVFKYARDGAMLVALKREVTIYRVLREALGDDAAVVRILDWNLDEPPYHTESAYVEGGDLADWLAAQPEAPLAARIELVAQCAEAVDAAHRVGVLHKDLKPGNVLVELREGAPRALLCDFGIGALLDPGRLAALGITRLGFTQTQAGGDETSGTPLYLAPEVVAGASPTTASDVFALGVMLYQLAVGDLHKPLGAGWERDVDDALLREDIALAADTDPRRRLANAGELAARLRALDARRESRRLEVARAAAAARLQEQAERGRVRRRWAAATIAVLAAGLVASSVSYLRAEREAAVAREVNRFLTDDLLAAANPYVEERTDVTVREVLDRARASVAARFAARPAEEAALRASLGRSYSAIGEYGPAREELERALALVAARERDTGEAALELRLDLGLVADLDSRYDDAEAIYRALVPDIAARHGAGSAASFDLARRLATLDQRRDAPERAAASLAALLPRARAELGDGHEVTIDVLHELGDALRESARYDEAERALLEARDGRERSHGADDPATLAVVQSLVLVERARGRAEAALAMQQRVLEGRERTLGRTHPETQNALNEVASLLQDLGRHAEAEAIFREVLALRERTLGDRNDRTRNSLNNLGLVLSLQGKLDEAEPLYRRALALERELLGPDHLDVLVLVHNLAGLERKRGRYDAAEQLHREAVDGATRTLGAARPEPGLFRAGLALTLQAAGRLDEARGEFETARAVLVAAYGADHPRVAKLDEMRAALEASAAAGR